MENTNGITMSAGIVSPVKGFGRVEGARPINKTREPISVSQSRESKKPVVEELELAKIEKIESESPKPVRKTNGQVADELFETAKTEGVDVSFEKLAKIKNTQYSDEGDVRGDENVLETNGVSESVAKMPSLVEDRVSVLERRINELAAENKSLVKKAEGAGEIGHGRITTVEDLRALLEEMIEMNDGDEKSKAKKKSLIEKLAQLLAELIMTDTAKRHYEEEKKAEQEAA